MPSLWIDYSTLLYHIQQVQYLPEAEIARGTRGKQITLLTIATFATMGSVACCPTATSWKDFNSIDMLWEIIL